VGSGVRPGARPEAQPLLRSFLWPFVLALAAVALVACSPAPSAAPAGSEVPLASGLASPSAAGSSSSSPAASLGAVGTVTPAPIATPSLPPVPPAPASVEPFTPPPQMEPVDDEICLALASREEVAAALGLDVDAIIAEGTDPNTALTCTYPAGQGYLLIATMIGDSSALDAELEVAIAYGQEPLDITVGDRAFYAARTADAPEQVTFVKGPVLVRLWNSTSATIGRADFEAFARGVANAIHAEIPPAP
jgi:hypothetical protein